MPAAVSYAPTDFTLAAAAVGMPAARITEPAQLRRADGPGPVLLDVDVDPGCYRHVLDVVRG
jgi:hypothetical protein